MNHSNTEYHHNPEKPEVLQVTGDSRARLEARRAQQQSDLSGERALVKPLRCDLWATPGPERHLSDGIQ
ncbi:hypothetical protein FQA47_005252 [Oryzias melastigma]|uniref:Uncharacterized protein n=1 Tax=Oryzias melastigma TaxID=30732 RepID=A0A834C1T9_ORYME|nr:hypothetical protein FQA47_005252 [Oryzias melastigma]